MSESYHYDLRSSPIFVSMSGRGFHPGDEQTHILLTQHILKGLGNPMMSCSLSPYVDDAKVADVVIPHALRRPHVQGPQYMHKFLLVDRSSNLYTNSF